MRRVLLLLLIALLPLRALAGDVMSLAMALDQGTQHDSAVAGSAAMPVDCPMLAQPSGTAGDAGESSTPACCDACTLCLAFVPLPTAGNVFAGAKPASTPPLGDSAFVSSHPAPELKPPIS